MKQTKTKLDICNICLSVPVGPAQPSEAQLERPVGSGTVKGTPHHRPLSGWLAILLSFPCFLFSHFPFFF